MSHVPFLYFYSNRMPASTTVSISWISHWPQVNMVCGVSFIHLESPLWSEPACETRGFTLFLKTSCALEIELLGRIKVHPFSLSSGEAIGRCCLHSTGRKCFSLMNEWCHKLINKHCLCNWQRVKMPSVFQVRKDKTVKAKMAKRTEPDGCHESYWRFKRFSLLSRGIFLMISLKMSDLIEKSRNSSFHPLIPSQTLSAAKLPFSWLWPTTIRHGRWAPNLDSFMHSLLWWPQPATQTRNPARKRTFSIQISNLRKKKKN